MKLLKLQNAPLLLLCSLSSVAFADGPATKINGHFTVASDVSAQESKVLASDLAYLKTLKPQANDAQLQQLMETKVLTEPVMEQWLADRVQYIISETTNLETDAGVVSQSFAFPNPGMLPTQVTNGAPIKPAADTQPAQAQAPAQGQGVLVMLNIGGGLYMAGKASNSLIGIKVAGVGVVPLTSPRVGVLQIGAGMFQPLLKDAGITNPQSRAYTIFHLATLFHEARHSDGNGKSLGFAHSLCPIDHDLAGLAGCDNSTNGAYTLDAVVMRNLTASCKDCKAADTEALKLEVLDSFSRVLKQSPTNEKLGMVQSICQMAVKDPASVPADVKDSIAQKCPSIAALPNPMIPASAWDPRPEGHR
jgi:hypothetical protein